MTDREITVLITNFLEPYNTLPVYYGRTLPDNDIEDFITGIASPKGFWFWHTSRTPKDDIQPDIDVGYWEPIWNWHRMRKDANRYINENFFDSLIEAIQRNDDNQKATGQNN